MTKEILLENHVIAKKTGAPSSFVVDGVRVDMRHLSSPAASASKNKDRPRPKPKKPNKAKPARATKETPAE